uniref:Uncharacterized protein n=1 Tax=Rhodosorus marinus TaxID=101924 RepID=A0A7S0BEJ8_9RHOD
MARTAVSSPGDRLFPALRGTWDHLVRDYPVQPEYQRKLMSAGFKGGALTIFNNIAVSHLDADAKSLWTLLGKQLFNHAHVDTIARRLRIAPGRRARSPLSSMQKGCGRPHLRFWSLCWRPL